MNKLTAFASSFSRTSQLKTDTDEEWKALQTAQTSTMLGEIQD